MIDPVNFLWYFTINRGRRINTNRPHILIKDYKNKMCLLIDMAILEFCNVSLKISQETIKDLENLKNMDLEDFSNSSYIWNPLIDREKFG